MTTITTAIESIGAHQVGPLRSTTTMTLQTRTAVGLWFGRKDAEKTYIVSFPNFASKLRDLEQSIEHDDPYADWHFIKIESAIKETKILINTLMAKVDRFTKVEIPEGVDVSAAISMDPEVIELRFNSTLAIKAAFLIAEYDQFARKCLLARHLGLIDRDVFHEWIHQGQRAVRSVIHRGADWKYTGVNRDDMAAHNARALLAVACMGECPPEILTGARRSPFARAKNST